MKKSIIFFAVIGGMIALATAIMYANKKNKRNKAMEVQTASNDIEIEKDITSAPILDLDIEKEQFSSTISERHKEAAQIIRNSLSNAEDYKEENSEHKEEFDEIDNSLDMLLDKE